MRRSHGLAHRQNGPQPGRQVLGLPQLPPLPGRGAIQAMRPFALNLERAEKHGNKLSEGQISCAYL
jgi:hypothetical protein